VATAVVSSPARAADVVVRSLLDEVCLVAVVAGSGEDVTGILAKLAIVITPDQDEPAAVGVAALAHHRHPRVEAELFRLLGDPVVRRAGIQGPISFRSLSRVNANSHRSVQRLLPLPGND
jgi:hypothetical protein